MTKILLSITIWLRKYQGREGNYYTICNALAIMMTFIYLFIYCFGYWIGKLVRLENNFITSTSIPLFVIILLSFIFFQLLIFKLRKKNIYLRYKVYKLIIFICYFLILTSIVLLLLK